MFTGVACGSGDAHTLAVSKDGTVWSWGDGDFGKLGRGKLNLSSRVYLDEIINYIFYISSSTSSSRLNDLDDLDGTI